MAKKQSAKPKKQTAKSKAKSKKPTPKPKKRITTPTKPLVALVTPAKQSDANKSLDALKDELKNLELDTKVDFKAYFGAYDQTTLTTAARTAVDEAQSYVDAGQPAVIVAAGTMATTILQGMTRTIPIIQAAGGGRPTRQNNVTGFYIDALGTSKSQFGKLSTNRTVTVLFDSTNEPPSNTVFQDLQAYARSTYPNVTLIPLDRHDPGSVNQNDIQGSFMLIPNALFYNKCNLIARAVERADVPAIYPEREYKKRHTNRGRIKVHGHNIPLTYRLAATYVDSILDGSMTIPLPAIDDAIKDED
jgi:hypothetical protein